MQIRSAQVAIGGVFSALCAVIMFMTAVIPFSTYAIPAMSGMTLVAVILENGRKTAFMVYVSTSVLSAFLVPDRLAVLVFIAFLGYYPIVKGLIERIKPRAAMLSLKLLLFNAAAAGAYSAVIYFAGMAVVLEDIGAFGQYGVWGVAVFWLMNNLCFVLYDVMLTRCQLIYLYRFRPRFLHR